MGARDLHDLTAAYALDALDADEAEAYEAHLGQCERCRDELSELSEAATALAWAADAPAPPQRLRGRILEAAAAERTNVVPLRPRNTWVFRATAAVAAAAACVAVGLGIWNGVLSHRLKSERSARAAAVSAAAILSDQAANRVSLEGGSGVVAVDPSGQGVLVVRRLAGAPAGKTYEAWVIPHGVSPQPAGTFHGGGSTTIVRLRAMVPRGATVAVTIEQAGGVRAPTSTPVLHAQA